jgi:eukaryotic-like serine/threonine-protein kinase
MISKVFSHYKILEKLGSGGIGIVYKALDLTLDRHVALKFLPLSYSSNEDDKRRFIQEAKTASSLDHPNICTIHEIQETDEGQLFIVMANYEGETLSNKISRGPISLPETIETILQISKGLSSAHSNGIIHRDIKPANIIITPDGTAKILDFGLAKYSEGDNVTKTGTTHGTIAFMSPEQAQGLDVDHRTDIWSLGVVFYEMLTGQLPFKGKFYQALMYSIVNIEPTPVTELCPEVPDFFQPFFAKLFSKQIKNRFPNVDEFIAELKSPNDNLSTNYSSYETPKPSKSLFNKIKFNNIWIGISSILLLGLMLWYSFFYNKTFTPNPNRSYSIAVADATNETQDPSLNSISGYFITSLEQSRRLSVLTRAHLLDILRRDGLKDSGKLDFDIVKEICKKHHIDMLVVPHIRKYDDTFTIEMRLIDPFKNDELYTHIEHANGINNIPAMVDHLTVLIREWIKENNSEIQSTRRQLAEITTDNIEAFNYLVQGEDLLAKGDYQKACVEFENAIKLDSTFGLAFYRLSFATGYASGEEQVEKELLVEAIEHIDNLPEKYRYLVLARKAQLERGSIASVMICNTAN